MLLRRKRKSGGGSGNGRNTAEFDLHFPALRRLRGKEIGGVLRDLTVRIRMEEVAGFVQNLITQTIFSLKFGQSLTAVTDIT